MESVRFLIDVLWWLVLLGMLGCFGLVVAQMYQQNFKPLAGTLVGLAVVGLLVWIFSEHGWTIVAASALGAFVYGWLNAGDMGLMPIMLGWTVLAIFAVLLWLVSLGVSVGGARLVPTDADSVARPATAALRPVA